MLLYYSLTISLSAFLLFLVQPLMGRYILPWFGGTPEVWSASMLFFQVLLLAGCAYSYGIVSRLSLRKQSRLHLVVLGVSVLLILLRAMFFAWETPITPGSNWQPHDSGNPIPRILAILSVGIGLPYFALSTTSSLLQAWLSRAYSGRSPYRLYALSNFGSLLGLIVYPFVIEPALSIKVQADLWSLGYIVFALGCGCVALKVLRLARATAARNAQQSLPAVEGRTRPGKARPLLWLTLSACPSLLLLATTNRMTQDIAVVPFLWVLPLALYLLSFVLCFANARWYSRWFFVGLFVATFLYCWVLVEGNRLHILMQLMVYALLLFTACMVCHGELARLRPEPKHLTGFYLLVSLGGVLGGVFVNLLAPLLFDNFWELPLGLATCWVLLLIVWQMDKRSPLYGKMFLSVIFMLVLALAWLVFVTFKYIQAFERTTLEASRNFYGVVWVTEGRFEGTDDWAYELWHGVTRHGAQYTSAPRQREPTAYYCEKSGAGLTLLHYPRDEDGLRVGVIGLGVGTLAAYGQPGDVFRFYEINPEIIRLAEGAGGYFTYLEDSPASVEIVPGDARLSLEHELAEGVPQHYDVLVLDAFNSHSIPVHLLTRECFEIYLAHLKAEGVLAVHISNPHLNLQPVLAKLADHFGMEALLIESQGDGQACADSMWVLITRNTAFLRRPEIAGRSLPVEDYDDRLRLWTDDYSNLFQILYWGK